MMKSISLSAIRPNAYNPNQQSMEQFAELTAELKRLDRVPKPVVVRRAGDGWTIVDGEHSWRAASDLGWQQIDCEVVDVDEVEAMRQTFKRNEHGTNHPVRLGRMFKAMLAGGQSSARALAERIGTSEGTVRNAMLYERAAALRNGYAADNRDDEMAHLSVRQIRAYVDLPGAVRNLWLDAGGDLKSLARATHVAIQSGSRRPTVVKFASVDGVSGWQALADAGLVQRVDADSFVESAHEAFRLLAAWRRYRQDTPAIDAYLRALAERGLPSAWADRLPCEHA